MHTGSCQSHHTFYGGWWLDMFSSGMFGRCSCLPPNPTDVQDTQCAKRHSLYTLVWVSIGWEGVDIPSRVEMVEASLEACYNIPPWSTKETNKYQQTFGQLPSLMAPRCSVLTAHSGSSAPLAVKSASVTNFLIHLYWTAAESMPTMCLDKQSWECGPSNLFIVIFLWSFLLLNTKMHSIR